MPQFDYKARQADGNTVTGRIESADRRQAAQRLQEQQLSPVTLKEVSSAKRSVWSQPQPDPAQGHRLPRREAGDSAKDDH
jgi:type II secretory pathway component PulF